VFCWTAHFIQTASRLSRGGIAKVAYDTRRAGSLRKLSALVIWARSLKTLRVFVSRSRHKCSFGLNRGEVLWDFSDEPTCATSVDSGRGWRDEMLLDGGLVGLFGAPGG